MVKQFAICNVYHLLKIISHQAVMKANNNQGNFQKGNTGIRKTGTIQIHQYSNLPNN